MDSDLQEALLRARVTILALGGAVVAYAVTAGIVTAPDSYDAPIGDDAGVRWILRGALAVAALINLLTAAYIRRAIIERGGSGDGERAPLGARFFLSTVVGGAFTEAVAVYGLALTLIGGEMLDVLAFGVVALIGLARLYPTSGAWAERARMEALLGYDAPE